MVPTGQRIEKELGIPLTIVAVILILAFWVALALVVVALFCGMRFSFSGPMATENLNDAMGKATDFAEGIKEDVFSKKGNEEE